MKKLESRDASLGLALAILLNPHLLAHPGGLAKAITDGASHGVVEFQQGPTPAPNPLLAKRSLPSTHNSGLIGDISSGSGGSIDKPVQPRNQPPRQPSSPKRTNYYEASPDFMRTPQFLNK